MTRGIWIGSSRNDLMIGDKMTLADAVRGRVLILDGAMGTMIQQYGLCEDDFRGTRFKDHHCQLKGNNDLLCLTKPEVVADIHRKYLDAGADIIETCTFNANRVSMADYGLEDVVREMNAAAVGIARRLADEYTAADPSKPRYVVASVGPTNKSCSISPDVENPAARAIDFDTLAAAYEEQMAVLVAGGVDALLIETIFDTLNAKAAVYAADKAMAAVGRRVPVMLSVTLSGNSGRTLSGQTLEAFCASMSCHDIFSMGLNCSFGAKQMLPFIKQLSAIAPCYISVYPNAGLPNEFGEYEQSPDDMARDMLDVLSGGYVNIVGGCCGTTDEHIRKYSDIIGCAKVHVPSTPTRNLVLSGMEALDVKPEFNFVNIGERCNVAGSRKFLRLIKEKNYDEALHIAREQVENGAQVLDVNMDDGMLDVRGEMVNFLNLMASDPSIARVPVMIDSSEWDVITAGLKCLQGKSIVNSISLKEGERIFLERAREVKALGAAVVVMAFDEKGQADTFERKIEICSRAYGLLVDKAGMKPEDIIFDPNVLAIGTGMKEHDRYALDFIRCVGWIHSHLPGVNVSGGVSNLSFAFRGNNFVREAIHAVFLNLAIKEGMNMGIVNPYSKVTYADLSDEQVRVLEDFILFRRDDALNDVLALAGSAPVGIDSHGMLGWRSLPLDERLAYALQHGVDDFLPEDLSEALQSYPSPIAIIEKPLMDGMDRVGELFSSGKMFLPQIVKTARTMKKAVEILQPYIEKEKASSAHYAGKILLATVKGDVHDIGKNIVSVVLSCNNYEVVDLGVMVQAEDIVRAAKEMNVDAIGLSGLITPSLAEMVNVVKLMEAEGLQIPVMIGGATTSLKHTAIKIAPNYSGIVVHVKDASQNVPALKKLLDPVSCAAYKEELRGEYEKIRAEHGKTHQELLSLEEARKRKPDYFSN